MTISMFVPFISEEAKDLANGVLQTRWIGEGEAVKRFEAAIKNKYDFSYALLLNSATSGLRLSLAMAGVGPGDEVITTAMTCLGYNSQVRLSDGSTKALGKIVNQKLGCEVISLGEDGQFRSQKVIGWIKLPSKGVEWYRVSARHGRGSRGPTGKRGIWLTGDHHVLTERGLIRVDELRSNDRVATSQRIPSKDQRDIIDGMLLGDAGLKPTKKGYSRLEWNHAVSQTEWAKLKAWALRDFGITEVYREAREGHQAVIEHRTTSAGLWSRERIRWYTHGSSKSVPDDLIMTPRLLAAWYMDDGSLQNGSATLCTESFSYESVWKLFWKLADMGFRPTISRVRDEHTRIHIGNGNSGHNSAKRFFEIIGPFIPPSMRYKLPIDAPPYNSTAWDAEPSSPEFDEIDISRGKPPKWVKSSFVYCIEVENTHNFIAGDIVVSNCTATNMPILEQYAIPQFADIQLETGAIDPNDIEHRITEKTKAIMCVHYGGYPCDMDELHAIANKYNLPLIEDAAQAIGAQYKGRNIGTISRFTVFSFQAIKQLTTVDGGLITLLNEQDYEEAKQRRWFGIDRDKRLPSDEWPGYYEWPQDMVGYKYNPTNLQAAIGLGNLPYLDKGLEHRQKLADFYRNELVGIPGIRTFAYKQDRVCSWFMFMVHVENRMAFHRMMKEKGIETSVCHVRNDYHSIFGKPRTDLPNLDKFQHTYLSLPIHQFITMEDADYIVNTIRSGW